MTIPKLEGKKIFAYGETNDIFDTVLKKLLEAGGAEVVNSVSGCFS